MEIDEIAHPPPSLPVPLPSLSTFGGNGGAVVGGGGLMTSGDNRALPPLDFSAIRVAFPTRTAEDERTLWVLNKGFNKVI